MVRSRIHLVDVPSPLSGSNIVYRKVPIILLGLEISSVFTRITQTNFNVFNTVQQVIYLYLRL